MSTTQASLLRRLRHSPLRDLVRLRATGRLDYAADVRSASLPQLIEALILNVVRRTRLFKGEKSAVAQEMISHFTEGLDDGASADDLIRRFGDPAAAAKLIRRAQKRNRGVLWQIVRAIRAIVCVFVIYYAVMAAIFFTGRPRIGVDYIAHLNRRADASPASTHGWPIYRNGLLAIPQMRNHAEHDEVSLIELLNERPGGAAWNQLKEWLDQNQPALALFREAASRPNLGFRLGANGSVNDPELYPRVAKPDPGWPDATFVISVGLPHLNDLRVVARILHVDAQAARDAGDSARAAGDVEALLGISEQLRDHGILVSDLVAVAVRALALDAVQLIFRDSPELWDDASLTRLAHRLSGPRVAADLLSADSERVFFNDIVQRMYTDDGHGDGRITADGAALLTRVIAPADRESDDTLAYYALTPAVLPLLASRRELTNEYGQMMDAAQANLSMPYRTANWKKTEDRFAELRGSTRLRLKFLPITLLVPAMQRVQGSAERCLAHQEATTTAIALELYRRANGKYPERLDMLVPFLLPSIPADRVNGRPLRYRLDEHGKPLLYSVGVDNDDDAGRVAKGTPFSGYYADDDEPAPDGDWVLYPVKND